MDAPRSIIEPRDVGALGIGWLLAIVVCGGASLFVCVGFALTWAVRKRTPILTRSATSMTDTAFMHEVSGLPSGRPSNMKLVKKRLVMAPLPLSLQYSDSKLSYLSGLSSRWTLKSIPPVPRLPPIPRSSTFRVWAAGMKRGESDLSKKRKSINWTVHEHEGEDMHHWPSMGRAAHGGSGRWLARDSLVGRMPTVQDLETAEQGFGDAYMAERERAVQQYQQRQSHNDPTPPPPPIHQQLPNQQLPSPLNQSVEAQQTTASTAPEDQSAEKIRRPPLAHRRQPSATDVGLRDILQNTEQRLRDGVSTSPGKLLMYSASRRPIYRRERSFKTSSSQDSAVNAARSSPSPTKKSGPLGLPEGSATSVNSATTSLIEHATLELVLPGGMASPSRLSGKEWLSGEDGQYRRSPSPPRSAERSPQRSPPRSPQKSERRGSQDSDVSSSLSTLYSEPDESDQQRVAGMADPFVETSPPPRPDYWQHRTDMLTRTLTANSDRRERPVDQSMIPSPQRLQRPQSAYEYHQDSGVPSRQPTLRDPNNPAIVLQPPLARQSEDVRPKEKEQESSESIMTRDSYSSFTSVSVDSISDLSDGELAKLYESPKVSDTAMDDLPVLHDRSRSPTASPVSDRDADMSSSPFNERDMAEMIIKASPKRALPVPPTTVLRPDGNALPTPLSPTPKKTGRNVSGTSSHYAATDFAADDDGLSRRPTNRSARSNKGGMSTLVADLRRMNSLVSSYSTTSMTSNVVADKENAVGSITQPRDLTKPVQMGSKHYYSIGTQQHKKSNSTGQQIDRIIAGSGSSRSRHGAPGAPRFRSDTVSNDLNFGKENQRLGTKTSATMTPERATSPALRDTGVNINSPTGVGSPKDTPRGSPNRGTPTPKGTPIKRAPSKGILKNSPMGTTPKGQQATHGGNSPSKLPKPKHTLVEDLIAQETRKNNRASIESLGLYDKDGFLINSPDREAHRAKLMRM